MQKTMHLCCIALISFCLAACDPPPIRVGFSGTLMGSYADLGVHGRNGTQLALEEINGMGGIGGRRLELLVKDDKGTPEGALQADRELIQAGVVAIIGHMTSTQTLAALPLINEAGVVLLSPTTSSPELSGLKDFFFRVQPAADGPARALARYAVQEKKFKRLGTVRDLNNRGYTDPFHTFFVRELEAQGGTLVMEQTLTSPDATDWQALGAEIAKTKIDALLVILSARDAATLAQTLHAAKISLPLLSSHWAMTEDLLTAGGKTVETIIFAAHSFRENPSPRYRLFLDRYFERFGHLPSFAAEYAFDAMHILALALEQTGGKQEGLKEALVRIRNFPGLHYPISLNAFGDTLSPVHILEVQKGQFEPVLHMLLEAMP